MLAERWGTSTNNESAKLDEQRPKAFVHLAERMLALPALLIIAALLIAVLLLTAAVLLLLTAVLL